VLPIVEDLDVLEEGSACFVVTVEGIAPKVHLCLECPEEALAIVLLISGERVGGRLRNVTGNEAVTLAKKVLIKYAKSVGGTVHGVQNGSLFELYDSVIHAVRSIAVNEVIVFDFTGGGDRPDCVVSDQSKVLCVAEIKGRIDKSNMWESWMPQVADHMRTWQSDFPDAERMFWGTVITNEMIVGESLRGTSRMGLRKLYKDKTLTGIFNLARVLEGRYSKHRLGSKGTHLGRSVVGSRAEKHQIVIGNAAFLFKTDRLRRVNGRLHFSGLSATIR
jgi:hypothetical protein